MSLLLPLRGARTWPQSRSPRSSSSPGSSNQGFSSAVAFLCSSLMCQYAHMLRLLPPRFHHTLSLARLLSLTAEAANRTRAEDRDSAGDEWREDERSASPLPASPSIPPSLLCCHSLALIKTRGCVHSTHTHTHTVVHVLLLSMDELIMSALIRGSGSLLLRSSSPAPSAQM